MQLRQFLRYFKEDTVIRIETTTGEGNNKQDVLLYSGSVSGILSTQQFFNSVLDANIEENTVQTTGKVVKFYV